MVNYLDSRRIAGTTAERSSVPIPATTGGWVELGRTTLGSAGDNITVSSLANKRYYMFLHYGVGSGTIQAQLQLGNGSIDTGSNYAGRYSNNGGADGTTTSDTDISISSASDNDEFNIGYIANYSSKEKLVYTHHVSNHSGTGATNAPNRNENAGKWANTSNPLDVINIYQRNSGDYAIGDELVVLGYDPSDTHTTNFWEELADITLSSAGDDFSSGTFTAKKYLWVQAYFEDSGGAINQEITFNNDTGNNYAVRHNTNGGTDSTSTSRANGYIGYGGVASPNFLNFFIINNASNEKLVIGHDVTQNTAGAGTAPHRAEAVFKWANTSNQITEIDFHNSGAGSYGTNSFIKVWGSD